VPRQEEQISAQIFIKRGDKLRQEGQTLAKINMIEGIRVGRGENFGRNHIKNG
jgi:hypothetical protein